MRKRLSLWLCGSLVILNQIAGFAANFSVTTSGFTFSPASITINVGDRITWNNLFGHTVTGDSPSEPFCGSSSPSGGTCSVTFNVAGTFSYHCIPHGGFGMVGSVTVNAAAFPPAVSITNPPNNALFIAPATIAIGVSATDSDGTIANVRLLTNGIAAATNSVAPFGFTLSNLAAGNYILRARAADNQSLATTSAPVTVRVAGRPFLSFQAGANGPLQFQFNTVAGVNYVVEQASPLTNFSPVVTNPGSGGALQFSETNGGPPQRTYRVRLQ